MPYLTGRSAVWFSASVWGAGGRWFKSSRPDHIMIEKINIFYTTISGNSESKKMAKKILLVKGIMCVNIIKNVESFYKEDNNIVSSVEDIMIIKTLLKKEKVEEILKNHHPYTIPFITQIKTGETNKDYLEWSKKNV